MDKIITDLKLLREVSKITSLEEIRALDLKERIKAALPSAWVRGFGLAAIQIGVPLRYAYYQFGKTEVELINPKIIAYGQQGLSRNEGCLSIPHKRMTTVRYRDIELMNNGSIFSVSGLEALIVQHEIDHMDGILVYDRAQNPFPSIGRNEACPCGSGKKYKKCCLK